MNIWVTGAQGQLGATLFKKVQEKERSTFNWFFTSRDQVDMTHGNQVRHYMQSNGIQIVINTAAFTDVEQAELQPQRAFEVNEVAVKDLARYCKELSAFLIHISTDFVFDGKKSTPYTERNLTNPLNVYGKSKRAGELHIENSGCDYLIFRTSWLYGAGDNHFVSKILKNTSRGSVIKVVNDQWGSPTYVEDIADFLIFVIESHSYLQHKGIYHFSNEGVCSRYDWARAIIFLKGLDVNIEPCSSSTDQETVRRPLYSALDTSQLRHDFSYPIALWEEALQRYLNKKS